MTEESKHTPGPWEARLFKRNFPQVDGTIRFDVFTSVWSSNGRQILNESYFDASLDTAMEAEANTRLIAKAWAIPELVKALEDCEKVLGSVYSDPSFSDVQHAIDAAQRALAKVKGE